MSGTDIEHVQVDCGPDHWQARLAEAAEKLRPLPETVSRNIALEAEVPVRLRSHLEAEEEDRMMMMTRRSSEEEGGGGVGSEKREEQLGCRG